MSSRFFFDVNIIGVAHALEREMSGVVYPGHADWPFDRDTPDEIWLPFVGDSGWCAIVRDRRIRYRRSERATMERHRVRAVAVVVDRNLTIAEHTDLLRGNWARIEATLARPPAFYHLTASGLREMLRY